MSRKSKSILFSERKQFDLLMADIVNYAAKPDIPNRDILLIRAAGTVCTFVKELMNSPSDVKSLVATIRVLRESSGPGKCSAEEELMNQLRRIGWECVGWLQESGLTPASHGTVGLPASDPQLQPLCDVVTILAEFARECFACSRPRDNFGGKRRTIAFEILGTVGVILDLPEVVELARFTIKKGRADALGAITFLEAYFRARKESPDADLKTALLGFSNRTKHRGLATAALNVLVEAGAIDEMDACDRIDDWKHKHWGGR